MNLSRPWVHFDTYKDLFNAFEVLLGYIETNQTISWVFMKFKKFSLFFTFQDLSWPFMTFFNLRETSNIFGHLIVFRNFVRPFRTFTTFRGHSWPLRPFQKLSGLLRIFQNPLGTFRAFNNLLEYKIVVIQQFVIPRQNQPSTREVPARQ